MSKTSFESDLRSSLRALSQSAPTGPTQANVVQALQTRTKRRQSLAAVCSAVLILAIGLSWLVLANLDRPAATPKPAMATHGKQIKQGGQQANPAGDGSITAAFNTTALLGHMNDIPFERGLMLQVAGLDAPTPPTAPPGWSSALDLDKIDFAYLPAQGDCIFCVAIPSLSGQRPF